MDATARGVKGGTIGRARVAECQIALEKYGKELDTSLLAGTWRLLYTSAPDVVSVLQLEQTGLFQVRVASWVGLNNLGLVTNPRKRPSPARETSAVSCGYLQKYTYKANDLKHTTIPHVPRYYVLASSLAPLRSDCVILRNMSTVAVLQIGEIYQAFTTEGGVQNVIKFSVPYILQPLGPGGAAGLTLRVEASYEINGPRTIGLTFREVTDPLSPPPSPVPPTIITTCFRSGVLSAALPLLAQEDL
eukprot:1195326-Prorocentrum_minimum.AAC.10